MQKNNAARLSWIDEFIRFGITGAIGFGANVLVVYSIRGRVGLYLAGLVAWLVAVTVTWLLNSTWTFRNRSYLGPTYKQWTLFAAANLLGFILYYGTFSLLVAYG